MTKDGKKRKEIHIEALVDIVQKQHQNSGELTQGLVKKILTNSQSHPHGIKVMLDSGEVGRVQKVHSEEDF